MPPRRPLAPNVVPPIEPWFLVRITAVIPGVPRGYAFEEWWSENATDGAPQSSGPWKVKTGGRVATASNPGYTLPTATLTEQILAVDDFAFCVSADGAGGLTWQLIPFGGGASSATCDSGSGSGQSGEPIYYTESYYCVEGHLEVWSAPVYQDNCSKTISVGDYEFDRYEGCCACPPADSGTGSGSSYTPPANTGWDCFNGECVPGNTYPTIEECQAYCSGIARYDCVSGICTPAVDGIYETFGECLENCSASSVTGNYCDTYILTGVTGGPITLTRVEDLLGITNHWVSADGAYELFAGVSNDGTGWALTTPGPFAPACRWSANSWDGIDSAEFDLLLRLKGRCPEAETVTISCGGGGSGVLTTCCELAVPSTLNVVFGGALAALGTVAVTWNPLTTQWESDSQVTCSSSAAPVIVSCVGTAFVVSYSTVYSALATPTTCDPLLVSTSATAVGPCAGAATADVTE